MMLQRAESAVEDRWDTEHLYDGWIAWEEEFAAVPSAAITLAPFGGRLQEGPAVVAEILATYFTLRRQIEKVLTYAHLRQDEDLRNDDHKSRYQRALLLYQQFSEQTAWIQPEFLALPSQLLDEYRISPDLAGYQFYLDGVIRQKPHTLGAQEEELMSMAAKAMRAPASAFSMMENADFQFDPALDQQGTAHPLTLGNYILHQVSPDRVRRKNAFCGLHVRFDEYANTLCELLNGQVQSHLFHARARKFRSCVEAALFPHHIDVAVYRNLISTVRTEIGSLHRYIALRADTLGLERLAPYDLAVSLVDEPEQQIPYAEASRLVLESVAPLGSAYVAELSCGLGSDRWVDRYEGTGKRSGAYSSGCYDSHPYILMNYTGSHRDVSTLAHEAGHSMHSLRSNQSQPYHYADYPIFVAEVASTFNEELLFRHVLAHTTDPLKRVALINRRIDDIRSTLFRQTLFAEFELWIHECAERGEPLTPTTLKEQYLALNEAYFGPRFAPDPLLAIEWARIPHFYYNFYVYQYATGISAALYLVDHVVKEGESARDAYLKFLASGYSDYPVELLARAGVDMRSPAPIQAAIQQFDHLVSELAVAL